MGQQTILTELRNRYLLGEIDKKQLEGAIFDFLLKNYERYHLFRGSMEEWSDLLTGLYPRISKAIDTYQETGSSFDTYINSLIHWRYKERKTQEVTHQVTEYTWWKARTEELMAGSPEAEYKVDTPNDSDSNKSYRQFHAAKFSKQNSSILESLSKQQILILFLKSYYFVTEEIVEGVSKSLNIKKEILWDMVDKLHTLRKKREDEIKVIEAGIECQYYRCLTYQKRLLYTIHGSSCHTKLTVLLERAQKRFTSMRKRLKGIRLDATNCQIAEILNIPKGTVDSSLHSIRRKSESLGFKWEKPLYSKSARVKRTMDIA